MKAYAKALNRTQALVIAPLLGAVLLLGVSGLKLSMPALAQDQQADEVTRELTTLKSAMEREKAERQHLLTEAQRLAQEEADLRTEAIASAKRAQALEDQLITLEADLIGLAEREKTARTDLAGKADQHVDILMALQRLAATPPEIVIALPRGPRDQLRTAAILKAALPAVDLHADMLRDELKTITQLRADILSAQKNMAAADAALESERTELEGLLRRKQSLLAETKKAEADAQRELAALAAKAESLSDMLVVLNSPIRMFLPRLKPEFRKAVQVASVVKGEIASADRDQVSSTSGGKEASTQVAALMNPRELMGGATRSIRDEKGRLRFPASGNLVTKFGQRLETGGPVRGVRSQGIELKTRRKAQVVAPFDGRVVYAGPFRGYRLLLIIQHDDGYHSLVAGLDRLDVPVGQWLFAGEPIGVMGDEEPKLYLEMRREGKPFDPLPWLASRKDKVS